MSRFSVVAALLSTVLLASCSKLTLEEAVYDDFKTNFLTPEKWDEELDDRREDRVQEKLTYLRIVGLKVEEERLAYAKRCDVLGEPNSSACQSVTDLVQVETSLAEVEAGLRHGETIKGSLGEFLNYGLDAARLEERTQIAKRVEKHFLPEQPAPK